jgi:4-hydroxy-4-methyl-2-oxoglutarate aldolase
MVGTVGFGYIEEVDRGNPELIEQLRNIDASKVTDAQSRTGTMDSRIKPIKSSSRILGPAVTVELPLGDNLMLYVALKLAQPGDVLVVNTNGNYSKAIWGELMTQSALALKLGGIVIDGFIRDIEANRERELPIFCCGSVPVSVEKNGPGFVNGEISCGGISVRPGDVIVGDGDGVVVVKKENLPVVLKNLSNIENREKERVAQIMSGEEILPSWVDRKIEELQFTNTERVLE